MKLKIKDLMVTVSIIIFVMRDVGIWQMKIIRMAEVTAKDVCKRYYMRNAV